MSVYNQKVFTNLDMQKFWRKKHEITFRKILDQRLQNWLCPLGKIEISSGQLLGRPVQLQTAIPEIVAGVCRHAVLETGHETLEIRLQPVLLIFCSGYPGQLVGEMSALRKSPDSTVEKV